MHKNEKDTVQKKRHNMDHDTYLGSLLNEGAVELVGNKLDEGCTLVEGTELTEGCKLTLGSVENVGN